MLVQRWCRERAGSSGQEAVHEGGEALVGVCMPCVGEVYRDHGGFELGMAQGALDEPGMHASFEQMGGVGMPQGMEGDTYVGEPSSLFGCAEGALDTGATHRGGCGRTLALVAPRGG